MKFYEIEFKYNANKIKLTDFQRIVEKMGPRWEEISSWDDYFVSKKGEFIRYRHNDTQGQLTIKRKLSKANNEKRIEVNLELSHNKFDTVDKLCGMLGYKHNFKIYKTCMIAWLDKINLVYYIVYDADLKEAGRFIEIEANESYAWKSAEEAHGCLENYESLLAQIGLNKNKRIKKSLYELFKKKP